MELSSKVTAEYKNRPLIDYVSGRYTYLSRDEWLERFSEGRISYKGTVADAYTIGEQGAVVTYDVPPFPQPSVSFDYSIIYEDEYLLAINKPANLRVHGKGRYMMANLTYHLRNMHEPPYDNIAPINRLDADTSGVVVFAKNKKTARLLGRLLEARAVDKRYIAIVRGTPEPREGIVDQPIGDVSEQGVPRYWVDAPKLKPSDTIYQTIQTIGFKNEMYSVVECKPITGRTHQLRVHLAWLGCPIVGDRLYMLDDADYVAWRKNREDERFWDWLPRHALHCIETAFLHPHTGKWVVLEAELAEDMRDLLARWEAVEKADD